MGAPLEPLPPTSVELTDARETLKEAVAPVGCGTVEFEDAIGAGLTPEPAAEVAFAVDDGTLSDIVAPVGNRLLEFDVGDETPVDAKLTRRVEFEETASTTEEGLG